MMAGVHFGCPDGGADTQLCLRTGGSNSTKSSCSLPPSSFPSPATHQYRPLTIFYAGRVCFCNVTAVQAGAIVSAAEREMHERIALNTPRGRGSCPSSSSSSPVFSRNVGEAAETGVDDQWRHRPNLHTLSLAQHTTTAPQEQLLPNTEQCMRRSLQRFLQKRGTRTALDASPYARRPDDHDRHPPDGRLHLQRRGQEAPPLSLW